MAAADRAEVETLRFDEPVPYSTAYELQLRRRDAVEAGAEPEALFLLEHPPTITLGRNAHEQHLLQSRDALADRGIEIVDVDRGGDVTYHGPGQLVAYPILHIDRRGLGITRYLRALEGVVIDTLAEFGVRSGRQEGFTGVWTDRGKIAAIGIGVHRGVTFHGTAINLNPDRTHWQLIVPCGIADKPISAIARELERPPMLASVADTFERVFLSAFVED